VAEERGAPYSWAGQQVEASIVIPGAISSTRAPLPMTASTYIGILEAVTDSGIVATLSDPDDEEEEPAVSRFYPWSSVLWLRPINTSRPRS
jgi:hypothetical protein